MSDALFARFSAEAAAWDSNPGHVRSSEAAMKAIVQSVPGLDGNHRKGNNEGAQPMTLDVLEIGCGTGLLSFMIAPHVRSLVGVDTAEGMISAFTTKLSQPGAQTNLVPVCKLIESPDDPQLQRAAVDLAKTVGNEDPATPKRFDLIISHLTLHHIPSLPSILELMYGCLAPGGRIALTDFEDTGEEAILFHPAGHKRNGVERHGIQRAEIERMMSEAGFRDVKADTAFHFDKKVAERKDPMSFPFLIMSGKK